MKIALSMKVDEVLKMFEDEFDIVLKINKSYNSDTKLLDISTAESKNISLNITKDTRVSAMETMFLNHFGIQVVVKNMGMENINPDIRLGDVKELYVSKLQNIETIETKNSDRADGNNENVRESNNTKKNSQNNINNKKINQNTNENKNQYSSNIKLDDHIEELILKIDKSYMSFQENEKYNSMASLLSIIESAIISFPDNTRLNKHIVDIKTKGYSISSIAVKKRKFSLMIFSILSFLVLAIGVFILCFDIYNHLQSIRKIENISREINTLNSSKLNALESKKNEEALAIEKLIEENNSKAQNIENSLNRNKLNLFLIIGFIAIIIVSVMLVKLEKYYIMSSRFYK